MGFVLSPAFAPESQAKYGVILVQRNKYAAVQLIVKCMATGDNYSSASPFSLTRLCQLSEFKISYEL
jgi:hypothetical protein